MEKLSPIREVREEANVLRRRLEDLEASIARMELNVEPASRPSRADKPGSEEQVPAGTGE